MNKHLHEHVESEAKYRGYRILFSKLGNFFIFIYNVLYLRKSLRDATELIDDMEKTKRN